MKRRQNVTAGHYFRVCGITKKGRKCDFVTRARWYALSIKLISGTVTEHNIPSRVIACV